MCVMGMLRKSSWKESNKPNVESTQSTLRVYPPGQGGQSAGLGTLENELRGGIVNLTPPAANLKLHHSLISIKFQVSFLFGIPDPI